MPNCTICHKTEHAMRCVCGECLESLKERLEQVTVERNAALDDLNSLRKGTNKCFACENDVFDRDKGICAGCDYSDNWTWRGLQEDKNLEQENS